MKKSAQSCGRSFMNPTPDQLAGWSSWVASRPPAVRAIAERFDPWSLYRLKPVGQIVTLYSIDEHEDGSPPTLTVVVGGEWNAVMFDRRVFGIDPNDLESCDPPEGEIVGTVLTEREDVDAFMDATRAGIKVACEAKT